MRKLVALIAGLLLLLTGCGQKSGDVKPMEELLEKTSVSMEEGHLFFTGKVTASSAVDKQISFYDAEAEKNTFYKVEVTDDPFGCMPEREVTLCILGATDSFNERIPLQKNKEYLFDTSLWVQEDEVVFLLPTFYQSIPERAGERLSVTDENGTKEIKGSYADYIARLKELAVETGYSPETVHTALKERLQSAKERNEAYFETLKFERPDKEGLKKTVQTADALLKKAEQTEVNWENIRGLLK